VTPRRLPAAVAAVAALIAAPAAADAASVQIDGDPLDIFIGETGSLQAEFPDTTGGQFFPPSSQEANAGFILGVDLQDQSGGATTFGYAGVGAPNQFAAGGQGPVTGSGAASDPYRQTTTFSLTTPVTQQPLTVVQTTTYVNGENAFLLHWDVTNAGSTPTTVRPELGADLYAGGSDDGTGRLESGPPRAVLGVSSAGNGTAGIAEVTPWASFQEDDYVTVFRRLNDVSPSGGLQGTVNPGAVDNGVGVQGPDTAICSGCSSATTTFEAVWRFTNTLSLSPAQDSHLVGRTQDVTVKAANDDGSPAAGIQLSFEIVGANPAQGQVTTGPDGSARISWRGSNAGSDQLSVYRDLNGNGVLDSATEPQRLARVEWIAPQLGASVGVEPVSGIVLVKLPPGASPTRYGLKARAAQAKGGFIPLTGAIALPVNSIVNADKGRLQLSSAKNARGAIQAAQFYSGTFQVKQKPAARPVTELLLKGGSFRRCPRAGKANLSAEASRSRRGRRVRRLWGSGKGNFRTRGRYSSATVRGTKWLTEDYCGGTLTRVPRQAGRAKVVVRDFARRKSITLTEGRTYLAVPRSRRGK
jgi:hypothetical protein